MSKTSQTSITLTVSELESWAYGRDLHNKPEDAKHPYIDLCAHFETVSEFGLMGNDKFDGMYLAAAKLVEIFGQTDERTKSVSIPASIMEPLIAQREEFGREIIDNNEATDFDRDFYLGLTEIMKAKAIAPFNDRAFTDPMESCVVASATPAPSFG